ncbi:MAG TPA: hypothetical protein PKL09_01280 [bacterium]|nr:hypothetical protein [bacterium]HNS33812.1 hypothetical protein [bacterium]HNZ73355.1 hypothetical protein [bacterium]HOH66983.1 hypothetical protein [bacterium]HQA63648.1 hypothetical protein [bacterium]
MVKSSVRLIILFLVGFCLLGLLAPVAEAQSQPIFYFFYSPTCSVCARQSKLIERLEANYSQLAIRRINVTTSDGYDLLQSFYDKYQIEQSKRGGTPVSFIEAEGVGGKYMIGYSESVDEAIEGYVQRLIALEGDNHQPNDNDAIESTTSGRVSLPFIGAINLSGLSPLTLSAVMGGLDGFNACAMVALGFLLAMILGGESIDRRKVFLIGGTFILVSGLIYFLFISAWLNLFMFLGYLRIITMVVGIGVVLFSLFLLKDYFSGIICKICDVPQDGREGRLTKWQRKLFAIMTKVTDSSMPLWLVLVTVATVAAGINLIELFCSFGFPVAYTKILTGFSLPSVSYYFYLLVYIGFYMLDDFLIFLAAVITLRVTKVSEKYLKAIKLISGLALLLLGLAILFRPEFLAWK